MRKGTAKNIAEKLEDEVFCRFGAPSTIVCDNGTAFTAKVIKILCAEWNITLRPTSSHNPQANFAERMNRNLVTMLASYIKGNHTEWDIHIQKFALALRTIANRITGITPAMINLGREIALPIDRRLHSGKSTEDNPQAIAAELPKKLKEITEYVQICIERAHQKEKFDYDKHHRQVKFKVGDKVWVRNHPISSAEEKKTAKLYPKWIGPYIIMDILTPVSYKLHISDRRVLESQHVHNLKPYYARSSHLNSDSTLTTSNQKKNNVDEQEEITETHPYNTRKRIVNYKEQLGMDIRKKRK
ncbi:unnamed protein product [Allacma fusca]|uniref:Integrase catalytic domain-containing protein n=1 Tax=Allacma fusca TaxID=39272 RepID=A0A8J2M472_9HEXA|nr:unnamed protein product [Allacma fusca]